MANEKLSAGFDGRRPLLDPAKGISTEELNAAIRHRAVMRRLAWILAAAWIAAAGVLAVCWQVVFR